MNYIKKEFPLDTKVAVHSVGNDRLEGKTGTILGKSSVNVEDYYIVLLDEPFPDTKAICITEHCLRLI